MYSKLLNMELHNFNIDAYYGKILHKDLSNKMHFNF